MNLIKAAWILVSVVSLSIAGCGGGGGSAGTTSGGSGSAASTASGTGSQLGATVAGLVYQLDKNSITNSGLDSVLITVTALDASNNPVTGVNLAVTVDSGIYTPKVAKTDASGQASGTVSIGGSKSNRNISATLTVGVNSTKVVIPVTGSQVSVSVLPGTQTPGAPLNLTATVADVNGGAVANSVVVFSGIPGLSQTVLTDVNGNATATATAPSAAGSYVINATASGVSAARPFEVIAAGGQGLPAAIGDISAASLAITPGNISPNTAGSTTNRAQLKAIFQTSDNKPISNVRVRFEQLSPQLDPAEVISTGLSTVYSDATGVAFADYIPGARSSPTNGVEIRACYGTSDSDIANRACLKSVKATLTVASKPLSISLGDNNELAKGPNNLTYIKKFNVAVVDAAGNAVPNAQISASVDLDKYGKGLYPDGKNTYPAPIFCANEDTNRNGLLDAIEKLAGDGDDTISPRKADVVLSFVGPNTTGADGTATIQVAYPQNVATWLQYSVTVTTSVAGSEGTNKKTYTTKFVIGDDANGSFLTPPYGINDCKTPN